ncbi:hypothetical protein JZ751_021649 [Albula glossodonta]|uniref:Tetraspanin-31 n=1 Tax=Albula glossodonta TaxID=121402 RepID=A0A8T2NIZ0_9TELE|nr:hypothetical protein JZ751_021649 [Albula glossodonta]
MVCGGFTCSKNALCSLNVVYMGYGIVSSIHIIGGVIAVGFFLLLVAAIGLIGAAKHHQVLLFFFGVSCSCLAMNREQQENLLNSTWGYMPNETKSSLETQLNCCGLLNTTSDRALFDRDFQQCDAPCKHTGRPCIPCGDTMLMHSAKALRILGGVGLFFSFTEILGVWLAARYRNQRDPRANPSAFL